jgi:hypothetical protein
VTAGLLVVVLLVAREVVRSGDPDGAPGRALGRMLVPAAVGLGLLMALRLVDVVVGRA